MATAGQVPPAVHERVRELLHRRGERMTAPRRAVLVALAERGGHVGAEQVVADVEAVDPGVHRSSVYRTLEALTRLGVVQHVHLGHGGTTYHLTEGEPHPHGQCTACGRVVDLAPGALDALAPSVRASSGFVVDPLHVALAGLCAACAAGAPGTAAP